MLSKNPYDVVRCMKSSEHGIWITVKGSSSIELWDPVSMTCKMKYDIKTGQYPYPQEVNREHISVTLDIVCYKSTQTRCTLIPKVIPTR